MTPPSQHRRMKQTPFIYVTRNPVAPVFDRPSKVYDMTIDEKFAIGGLVLSVNASDADGVS